MFGFARPSLSYVYLTLPAFCQVHDVPQYRRRWFLQPGQHGGASK